MPGVTEVAILPLKPGVSFNPNDDTGTVYQEALTTLLSQPGIQRVYWGTEEESPNTLYMFVDWDEVDSHIQFMKGPAYQPFLGLLGQIMDGKPTLYHVKLEPHPPSGALGANTPMTEVLTVEFPSSVSESTMSSFESRLREFASVIESNVPAGGYRGSAGGWSVESDVPIGSEQKGKVFVALLGWESVAAHMACRETEHFKNAVHLLRDAEGLTGMRTSHVATTENHAGGFGADETGHNAGDVQEEVLNPQQGGKVPPKTRSDGTTTKNAK